MANQFGLGLSAQEERDLRRRRAYYANLPEGKLAPDVAKSAASGVRSGLESAAAPGDISTLQQSAARWLGDKFGIDPEMLAAAAAKWTSPLSLLPTSEDITAASDRLFGRDAITRHTPETEMGETAANIANVATSALGGPEDAVKAAIIGPGAKLAKEALTYKHPISGVKLKTPIEHMNPTYEPMGEMLPKKLLHPEKTLGGHIIPMRGDPTIAGQRLTGVGGPVIPAACQSVGRAWLLTRPTANRRGHGMGLESRSIDAAEQSGGGTGPRGRSGVRGLHEDVADIRRLLDDDG